MADASRLLYACAAGSLFHEKKRTRDRKTQYRMYALIGIQSEYKKHPLHVQRAQKDKRRTTQCADA